MTKITHLNTPTERLANDARLELVFDLAQERPPVAAKLLIMRLRSPEVAFLDDQQADLALDALNLKFV